MAIPKNDAFNEQEQQIATMAKALSHPARVAILRELAAKNSCVCGDIVTALPLAQATVSQHLKELKKVGLIKGDISGAKICYCINWQKVEFVKYIFNNLFSRLKEENNKACC